MMEKGPFGAWNWNDREMLTGYLAVIRCHFRRWQGHHCLQRRSFAQDDGPHGYVFKDRSVPESRCRHHEPGRVCSSLAPLISAVLIDRPDMVRSTSPTMYELRPQTISCDQID